MTALDFRSPPLWDIVGAHVRRALARQPVMTLGALVLVLASLSLALVDAGRLRAQDLRIATAQARFDATARDVASLQRRAQRVSDQRRALDHALTLRRSNLLRAREVAVIGNALPEDLALNSLEQTPAGWVIAGRTRVARDVALAVERLVALGQGGVELTKFQRAEHETDTIAFEIVVGP